MFEHLKRFNSSDHRLFFCINYHLAWFEPSEKDFTPGLDETTKISSEDAKGSTIKSEFKNSITNNVGDKIDDRTSDTNEIREHGKPTRCIPADIQYTGLYK